MGIAGRARFSHIAWFSGAAKPGQCFESIVMAIFWSEPVPDFPVPDGYDLFNLPVGKVRAE